MDKNLLIDELLHYPLSFTDQKLNDLLKLGFGYGDMRECIKRIYDLSEAQLTKMSNAGIGLTGMLNRLSTHGRVQRFNRKIKKLNADDKYKIIYAEGDSWFQFPYFVKDIIDWLSDRNRYLVYSDAFGGDLITNIIYESQYVYALSELRPGYFLLSGGGNDLVGNNRLAIMIWKDYNEPKYRDLSSIHDPSLSDGEKAMILKAQNHITKEFYAFLWVIKAQYLLLFRLLYAPESTQKDVITITQGYDYAIPGIRPGWTARYPFQLLINRALENGCWLERPLKIRGIFDEELQRALVLTFIYEFNRVFISIANNPELEKVYHVDCRGLADKKSWYDELHYKSHVFRRVAKAYEFIIENHGKCGKVIRAGDF